MNHTWAEVHALGIRAATGAGVPPAQALAFGAMLPRHLADGGSQAPVSGILTRPDTIIALATRVEFIIERSSLSDRVVTENEQDAGHRALLVSWLHSLPCQATVAVYGEEVSAHLNLAAPSARSRPDQVQLGDDLYSQLSDLAERTYVPDSDEFRAMGAGANMMELD